jgi:hypothetical protein
MAAQHPRTLSRRAGAEGALPDPFCGELAMSLGTILLIVLILMLVGVLPTWPHSGSWGYLPSGGLGLLVVIVLVLVLTGRL